MPKSFDAWTVLPHTPIEKLEDNLWRVEGTLPNMPLKRVMAIAKLANGDLVVHNPIALDAAEMKAIDGFGRVAFLVVPNGWHRMDLKAFAGRYPEAKVLAPSGSRAQVGEVHAVTGDLSDVAESSGVSLFDLDGTRGKELVMRVVSHGRSTLVFGDAIFCMPHLGGVQGFVLRHLTHSSGTTPHVSRVARWMLLKDKPAFAAHLERLATPELARVIVAHHQTISERPADALRAVAAEVR